MGLLRGLERYAGRSALRLIRKNAYLVTLALVSPTRNSRSRAQTSIFTIENQHFVIQIALEASWPPDVSAGSLVAAVAAVPVAVAAVAVAVAAVAAAVAAVAAVKGPPVKI